MPGDDVRTISHWTPHVDSKSGDLKTSPAPRTTHSQDYLILVITARSIISSVKMSSVHLLFDHLCVEIMQVFLKEEG